MPAPMLEWLPIRKLVVDDRYQRPLTGTSWAAIRKIAGAFHWSRFAPVLVAPVEGGLYAIIDGQHRTHAAALCGFTSVPAMAVHMTAREQASAFTWVNGQVLRINQHQVYRAALAAGEDWALRCRDAVEAAGCRLMTYLGLVTEDEVRRRAAYDLAQAEVRGVFYTLEAPAEAIVCRRGDLVGVQHDLLTAQAGAGRVIGFAEAGGGISQIRLDAPVPVASEPDLLATANLLAVADMLAAGRRTGAAIRRATGSITIHPIASAPGETDLLTFAPPIPAEVIAEDVLVAVGDLGREVLRLIVFGVTPRDSMEASLTLVDEGQELWA